MDLPQIIEDLYEGTLDPVSWDRAMLSIADSVRASGVMLFAFNPCTGAVLRDENHRVDPQIVTDYAERWTFEDIRRNYLLTMPTGEPATEGSLAISELKRSPIYNEFLLPVDMPHFMPAWIQKSKERAVALSLQGSRTRGPFESKDLEKIRHILPHLARSLEIRDRLETAKIRADNLANVLDSTAFGVIVLDGGRKIVEVNALASALLREGSGLRRGRDETVNATHRGVDLLSKGLLAGAGSEGKVDGLLRIPREDKLPLSILVLPICKSLTSWLSATPAYVLLLFDPERRLAVNRQVAMNDLDLSEREAEVATLLAAGLRIDQIAKRMHISIQTVRSQLKSAFHKSGCHTQAQLVRRLLLGPSLIVRK